MLLEKILESLLDCKEIQADHLKGNQSWISLAGLMLKLKLQYFDHLMQGTDSFEKTLRQRTGWLDDITNSRSLLRLMFIRSVMPSSHLILYCTLLLLPSIFPSIRVFSSESVLHIR